MGGKPSRPDASSAPIKIRAAEKHDLDAITDIVKAGFPDDPGCDYKYPYRDKYSADFREWTRREYEEYLDQPDKFAVLVAIVAADAAGSAVDQSQADLDRPIAYAVWNISVKTERTGGDHGLSERRDANPEHMRAYSQTVSAACTKYLSIYGNQQLSLEWLITHPSFRRRGAGTKLCRWGEEEAAKRGGWTLTVMASPMGKLLYAHLGYRLVGTVTAGMDGEEETVDIDVLSKEDVCGTARPA